jgi:hypothetical protein
MYKKLKVFALSAVFAVCGTAASARDCSLKQLGSLDMTFQAHGFSVPVGLNGTDHLMRVSLSGSYSLLKPEAVKQIGLTPIDARSEGMVFNNADVLEKVIIPVARIGSVSGGAILMYVVPKPDEMLDGSDGILGSLLLRNFDVEFDFKSGKMNLFSHDHCDGQVVYWADNAVIEPFHPGPMKQVIFDMTLDGVPVHGVFNTGDAHGMMMMTEAKRLFGLTPSSPGMVVKTRDDKGVPTLYEYHFKTLSLGGISISNLIEEIYPDDTPDSYTCDGRVHNVGGHQFLCYGMNDLSVGLDVMRQLRLYFAFNEGKLYATAADAHK